MLTCLALAGSLYINVVHDPAAGVRTRNLEWEWLIPLEGTTFSRDTDHGASSHYRVFAYTIDGKLRAFELEQERYPNFSPIDILVMCEEAQR